MHFNIVIYVWMVDGAFNARSCSYFTLCDVFQYGNNPTKR